MTNLLTTHLTEIRLAAKQVTAQGSGKYLLNPKGDIIIACDLTENRTHDDWACEHQGVNIENLLDAGWVRVQNVFPNYLLVDAMVDPNQEQRIALGGFIFDEELRERNFGRVLVEVGGVGVEVRDLFCDTPFSAWSSVSPDIWGQA